MEVYILRLMNIFKKTNIFWAGALILFITSCSSDSEKDDGKAILFKLNQDSTESASLSPSGKIAGTSFISLAAGDVESEIKKLAFNDLYVPEEQYFSKVELDKADSKYKQEINKMFSAVKPAAKLEDYAESFVGGVIRIFAEDYDKQKAKIYKGSKDDAISESYFSIGGAHNSEFSAKVKMPAAGKSYIVFYLMDYITTVNQLLVKDPNFSVDPSVGLLAKKAADTLGDDFRPGHVGTSSMVDLGDDSLDDGISVTVQRNEDVFIDQTFTTAKELIPLMAHSEAGGNVKFSNFAIDKDNKHHMIGYSINLFQAEGESHSGADDPFIFTAIKDVDGKFGWPYGYVEIKSITSSEGFNFLTRMTTKYDDKGAPLKYQNVKWNSGANANAYSTWKCVVRTAYDGGETIWDISSTPRTLGQGAPSSVCESIPQSYSDEYSDVHNDRVWVKPDMFDVNGLALGDLEHKMDYFLPTTAISIKDHDNYGVPAVYSRSATNHTLEKATGQTAEKYIYLYDYKDSNIKATNKGSVKKISQSLLSEGNKVAKFNRDGTAVGTQNFQRSGFPDISKGSISQIAADAVGNGYYFATNSEIFKLEFDSYNDYIVTKIAGKKTHVDTKGLFGETKGEDITTTAIAAADLNFEDITGLAIGYEYNVGDVLYVTDGRGFVAKIDLSDLGAKEPSKYLFVWNDADDDNGIDYNAGSTTFSPHGQDIKRNKVELNSPSQLVSNANSLYVLDDNKVFVFSISDVNGVAKDANIKIDTVRAYPGAVGHGIGRNTYQDKIFSIGEGENGIFLTAGTDHNNIFVYYYEQAEYCELSTCPNRELAAVKITNKKLDAGSSTTFVVSNPIRLGNGSLERPGGDDGQGNKVSDTINVGGSYVLAYAGALHAFDLNGYVKRTGIDFPSSTTSLALHEFTRDSSHAYPYQFTHFLASTAKPSDSTHKEVGDVVVEIKR
ncbi:MAG: hypothetical protein JJV97_06280 [SAR324 cluster bacterium]|nr:hypothetical protein [SAR324 cluster bacterium]